MVPKDLLASQPSPETRHWCFLRNTLEKGEEPSTHSISHDYMMCCLNMKTTNRIGLYSNHVLGHQDSCMIINRLAGNEETETNANWVNIFE